MRVAFFLSCLWIASFTSNASALSASHKTSLDRTVRKKQAKKKTVRKKRVGKNSPRGSLYVKRVIDGDTLMLSDNERVRLVGVDTPEEFPSPKLFRDARQSHRSVAYVMALGRRAAEFTRDLVQGRPVTLHYEKGKRTDRYDRTLAYVDFSPINFGLTHGRLGLDPGGLRLYREGHLNALLVEAGYAKTYTQFPFQQERAFLSLETKARQRHLGLW